MHQHVVVDGVEEFRQVNIHGNAIPLLDVGSYLLDSIVGAAVWAESVSLHNRFIYPTS